MASARCVSWVVVSVHWSESFVPSRDRGEFDESEFALTLEYFGNPVLPDRYVEFLRSYYEMRSRMFIGYEARDAPDVLGPRQMRSWADGHFWGREFMPFMANTHAFVAFDLRAGESGGVPPIVFLNWDLEEADWDVGQANEHNMQVRYERAQWLADDLDGFLNLLGLWRRPDGLPKFRQCHEYVPYQDLGIVPNRLVFPLAADPGYMLRSGRFGPDGLRVGRLMGCVGECPDAPELVEELTVRRVWERIRQVVGDRLVPFMTGEDGWLALDYRQVDREPPVVFIPRDGDMVAGEPQHVADSVIDAYDRFT